MNILKGINILLSFLLELAMLIAIGYWGYHGSPNTLMKWALAIGLPLLVIFVWGMFFAPKSNRRLPAIPGSLLSLGLFLLAAFALYQSNQPTAGIILAIIAIVNRILTLYWKQW
jgi:hypothetical protein